MAFQQVGLRVDVALLEKLDKYVEATGIARSTVVRIATQKYIDAWEAGGEGSPPESLLTASPSVSGSLVDKIAQLEKKVEVLQRQVGPASIF